MNNSISLEKKNKIFAIVAYLYSKHDLYRKYEIMVPNDENIGNISKSIYKTNDEDISSFLVTESTFVRIRLCICSSLEKC